MKSSVDQLNDTRVKVTVEVPFSELGPELDKAYQALAQQINIPGFRRGKAPRQLIDARVGRGPVLEQVVNDMLPTRYGQAIEELDIKALGQPNIDITKLEDGDVIEFVAEVDVRPEFDLPDFSDISVEVPALGSTEERIDHELEHLRERFGSLKTVDREAGDEDFITLNLSATVDGEEIEDAKVEDMSYRVGSGDLIEGLDEAVKGLKADESATFTSKLVFGEYADKDAEVTVTVTAVKERELPELDDDFAQMASEFDTVEELRADLASGAEESAKAEQAASIREEVLKVALEKTQFPLPASVVDEQVNAQVQQLMGQLGGDEALFEKLLEAQGTSREEFNEQTRTSAEEAVRTQLFLDVLAEKEEPEVTQDELNDHIVFTARRYGVEPQQFLMQLQQSGQLLNLVSDVRRGKALANAICSVTVKDSDGNDVDPKIYFGDEEETAQDSDES
ncbi:trigger factor [Corynebacterium durum]|mgnify:CR=1 FL=1|uniref:trigger factor n=1 Tax=Corynebacterium durum TaxID=61592 RepID=UPI0015C7522F|nr:trigger factor [Corynebacterium durum]NYI74066.1 trigger factor [Corynebacterium durum]WJY85790.1 Trigger factor [Corynebacterium durum]